MFKPPSKDYVPPPPRDGSATATTTAGGSNNKNALTVGNVLNGHKERGGLTDAYIPPKTKNDVPKNFLRPEDLPPPPSPDEIDFIEDVDDELAKAIEDLEEDGAFLGLAKLKDGRRPGEDEDEDDLKKAKYVNKHF